MKNLFLSVLLISISSSCIQDQQTSQNDVEVRAENVTTGKTYGTAFTEDAIISMEQLQKAVLENDSVQAVVKAKIEASCQSKGCWMDIRMADNTIMKVTFKDYGFFLPVEDLAGKEVVFKGMAKRKTISIEDQQHYAKDAGKSQKEIDTLTEPKEELIFVADGVIIK